MLFMDDAESNSSLDCKIISSDANEALEPGEVVDYLDNASITYKEFLTLLTIHLSSPKEEHCCYMIWGQMKHNGKAIKRS